MGLPSYLIPSQCPTFLLNIHLPREIFLVFPYFCFIYLVLLVLELMSSNSREGTEFGDKSTGIQVRRLKFESQLCH